MDIQALHREMSRYDRWKQTVDHRLARFDQWAKVHGLVSDHVRDTLKGARALLKGEGFTIACVGEFSRGKTELINALLVGKNKERILPSLPGRTTMCPTEIHCDPDNNNCVRLLPIETRRSAASLESFRRIPEKWVTLRFDPNDPHQTRKAIGQVSASRWVEQEEARLLGFSQAEWGERDPEGRVAIPHWRHAMISLDHPLLRQGLRIIDTPGLNALGNEPELTLKILPQAQAILFLLAADSGVSASDMTIWHNHVQGLARESAVAVLGVLNKMDSLWDDLHSPKEIDDAIDRLRKVTAHQLRLTPNQIVPISAKQALFGRVQEQPQQVARSGFSRLEQAVAETVERRRRQLASHRLLADSQALIIDLKTGLDRRLVDAEQELLLLSDSDQNDKDARLAELRETIRQNHRHYHKQALSLRTSQKLLEKQRLSLLAPVDKSRLEEQIEATRAQLTDSWTSLGLARGIKDFFDHLDSQVRHLEREVERANRVLASIYQRPEHGSDKTGQRAKHRLDLSLQYHKLRQLHRQADQFRASLNNLLSLKSILIQRFIGTLVQEARSLWNELSKAIDAWLKQALNPLFHHNQYQKQMLEHHTLRLTRLRSEAQGKSEQVKTLRKDILQLEKARDALVPLYQEVTGKQPEPLPEAATSTDATPAL